MKKTLFLLFVIALAVFVVSSCGEGGKKDIVTSQAIKDGTFTLVFSGNVGGLINPCGCRIPLGGIARRATVINRIKEEAGDILVLDSGAMLYQSQYIYPPYDFVGKLQANFLAQLVNDIGIHALNVSSYDLANSADSLLAFDKMYKSQWLSSNIVWRDSQEPVFKGNASYTIGDYRVGVFGLMATKSLGVDIFKPTNKVDVTDSMEAARAQVAALKDKSDIIIALAYMDLEEVKGIIRANPEINVVVMSHTRQHNPSSEHDDFKPVSEGNAVIVRCPDGGRVVGRLDLNIVDGSLEFVDKNSYVDLRPIAVREKDPELTQSTFVHTFTDLGEDIEHEPGVVEKISTYSKGIYAYVKSIDLEYKIP